MKNLIKQKHIGIMLTLAGIVLVSLNFLSYLMSSPFVSKTILPFGILLLLSGIIVIKRTGKKQKGNKIY